MHRREFMRACGGAALTAAARSSAAALPIPAPAEAEGAMEFNPLGNAVKELRDARELAVSSVRSARVAASFASGRVYESA